MSSYINPEIVKTAMRTPEQTAKQILSNIRLVKKELKDIVSLVKDGKYSEIEHQSRAAAAYLEAICSISKSPTAQSIESGASPNVEVDESEESESEPV